MDYENQIAERINQYIPDLRKQIHTHIRAQLAKNKKQLLSAKANQMRDIYMQKLQSKVTQMKENIHIRQNGLRAEIDKARKGIKDVKSYTLSQTQKKELIETTVREIKSDEQMVDEIKSKMRERVEQRVLEEMELEVARDLEGCREEFMEKNREAHLEWEEERYEHWKEESERELSVLAEQYRELECKRSLIQESLSTRKVERDALLRRQKVIMERNNEISSLKQEIKLLS